MARFLSDCRRFSIPIILLLAQLILSPVDLSAQGSRCEWTDCSAASASSSASTSSEDWTSTGPADKATCLEFESLGCDESCKSMQGAGALRCRRECLLKACPGSDQFEASREAMSPGILKCVRCKESATNDCQALCIVGKYPGYPYTGSGLGNYACLKACVAARCGMGCVVNP